MADTDKNVNPTGVLADVNNPAGWMNTFSLKGAKRYRLYITSINEHGAGCYPQLIYLNGDLLWDSTQFETIPSPQELDPANDSDYVLSVNSRVPSEPIPYWSTGSQGEGGQFCDLSFKHPTSYSGLACSFRVEIIL